MNQNFSLKNKMAHHHYRKISQIDDSTISFMKDITKNNHHFQQDGRIEKDDVNIQEWRVE